MHYVDMDALPYMGTSSNLQERGGRAGKRKRSVSVLRKEPRGLHGGYARRSRKVAAAARVVEPSAPQGTSYAERMAQFGSVGKDYNEN